MKGGYILISFIKSNLNILIPILVLFFTFDTFLLAYKVYLRSIANLKISCDNCKNYYYDEGKLAIINLTVENKSTSSVNITGIKLTDESKSYSATFPKMLDTHNENEIYMNISSKNIPKYINISSHGVINGYAAFENIGLITKAKGYKLVIETPSRIFKKKITINSINSWFQPVQR